MGAGAEKASHCAPSQRCRRLLRLRGGVPGSFRQWAAERLLISRVEHSSFDQHNIYFPVLVK